MVNDKKITISHGSSRQSKVWQPQTLLLSELYSRLKTPVRGQESLAVYLSLPKPQQDDLKDVGGFVGGEVVGGRRKAGSIAGRDLLTLDLDNIPTGESDTVLKRVEGLGCGYCVYSTRKHSPAAPRLRIVIPFDRTVTAEEYEPIGRKLAEIIGIEMADPTTFEVSRLMYYPSCCADSEFLYYLSDKPFLSADGALELYKDWHDVSTWPQAPGEDKAPRRMATKQGDPTAKNGVVGAFCKIYDIQKALEAFLPGVYAPTDISDDRLTYTGGSTTGGAILYDGGKFLFSHHGTDPCSGKLVNAFDLVRLHKFGDMDDGAAPGTPTVQLPSFKAMTEFAKQDTVVSGLLHKEEGQKILEAFQTVGAGGTPESENELAEFLGGLKGEVLTTEVVRRLVRLLGLKLRLNEITWQVELSGYPREWSKANAENLAPVLLLDHLRLAKVKGATKGAIADCLDIIAEEQRYNPVSEMLSATPWDGTDRLPELYSIWGVTDLLSQTLIRKWLMQSIAMALNDEMNPQGADGVLVLQGSQGVGKTSAFRALVPLPRMFKEGAKLDLKVKDTVIQALNGWVCELGELDRTTARDSAGLKAFITQDMDEYRTPYARKAVQRPRRTSFCGTVNPGDYLVDDTGNRRFWTVPAGQIDLDRLFSLTDAWKAQLWSQMYAAYQLSPSGFRLTSEERGALEGLNVSHTKPLEFEDELRDLLNFELSYDLWGEFTAAQIASKLESKPTARRLGRVISKIASEDARITSKILKGRRLYRIPLLSNCAVSCMPLNKYSVGSKDM